MHVVSGGETARDVSAVRNVGRLPVGHRILFTKHGHVRPQSVRQRCATPVVRRLGPFAPSDKEIRSELPVIRLLPFIWPPVALEILIRY